jgi:hypothetical protein
VLAPVAPPGFGAGHGHERARLPKPKPGIPQFQIFIVVGHEDQKTSITEGTHASHSTILPVKAAAEMGS